MKLIITENYAEMSSAAAKLIVEQVKAKPDCVLGLATGSTPEGTYAEMIKAYNEGKVDFSKTRSVNLDEYYPLAPENDQSYRYFMNTKLFDHINIDKKNTCVPDGLAKDPANEGARYDQMIADLGGVDLQVLGIGQNGHVGFNEPGDSLVAGTHLTDLTPQTIKVNSRFFAKEEDVPKQAMTMGMASIFGAKHILLLISGKEKHNALAHLLKGDITTQWPATLLNLHGNVTCICDKAAYEG